MELSIEYLPIDSLKPYKRNNKKHDDFDIGEIAKSIDKYGFNDPIGIYGKNIIVEGHGRLLAAKKLGMKTVPCIRLDHMSDKERREYAIIHNKSAELAEYDFENLFEELPNLDFSDFNFDFELPSYTSAPDNEKKDYETKMQDFQKRMETGEQTSEEGEEYQEFVKKFERTKTSDDCYTPPIVYEAVADYVSEHYGVSKDNFVRPFYPGGDYQSEKYAPNDIVVDNPPFSILAEIIKYYIDHGVKFFLFAPTLTIFSSGKECSCIICGCKITYENGAVINTSFVTNLENCAFRCSPDLYKSVSEANGKNLIANRREVPRFDYPPSVVTSSMIASYSKFGIEFEVSKSESFFVRQLDSQKESGNGLFGSGYLISDRKKAEKEKAEKAKAEKARAIVWELSEREKAIIQQLE